MADEYNHNKTLRIRRIKARGRASYYSLAKLSAGDWIRIDSALTRRALKERHSKIWYWQSAAKTADERRPKDPPLEPGEERCRVCKHGKVRRITTLAGNALGRGREWAIEPCWACSGTTKRRGQRVADADPSEPPDEGRSSRRETSS